MGNTQFQLPNNVRQQWDSFFIGEKQFAKNKITNQVFQFMVLSTRKPSQSNSGILERSIYSIPKTPKIIILYDQFGETYLLVQQEESSLQIQIPKICVFIELLQIIKDISLVAYSLYKKYGGFKMTETMIGINKNMQIMLWINEQNYKNEIQYPIEQVNNVQHQMIDNLVAIIQRYTHFNTSLQYLKKQNNFSAFISTITELISTKRIQLGKYDIERPLTRAKRVLTPDYPYDLKKQASFNFQNQFQPQISQKKRPNIPNFIKNIKQKKLNVLDTLNHKRTMTKQDFQIRKNSKSCKNIKKKHISDHSNQISQVRSMKPSPLKQHDIKFSYSNLSKLSKNVSNAQTCQHLTSSGQSINKMIKKRNFTNKNKSMANINIPRFSVKEKSQFNPQNQSEKDEGYLIFTSQHKSPPKVNLVSLCTNTTQSKYFQNRREEKSIIKQSEQQNQKLSRMLQEQLDGFFSSGAPSPRNQLGFFVQHNENVDLREQFKRIINF